MKKHLLLFLMLLLNAFGGVLSANNEVLLSSRDFIPGFIEYRKLGGGIQSESTRIPVLNSDTIFTDSVYLYVDLDSCTLNGLRGDYDHVRNVYYAMVSTNVDYTDWVLSSSDSWLEIGFSPNAPYEYGQLMIQSEEYYTGSELRYGTVSIIVAPGVEHTIYVTQEPFGMVVDTDLLYFSADSCDKKNVSVISFNDWGVSLIPDWLSASICSKTYGEQELFLTTTEANSSAYDRSDTVLLFGMDDSYSYYLDHIITVTQEGNPTLDVPIDSVVLYGVRSLSDWLENCVAFDIETNVDYTDWVLSSSESWVSLEFTSPFPEEDGNTELIIESTEVYHGPELREAYLYIDVAPGVSDSIHITQLPFMVDINPDSLYFSADSGEVQQVNITSYNMWSLESYSDWWSVSVEYGAGNSVVSVATEENTSAYSRTDVVWYASFCADNSVGGAFYITQEGNPYLVVPIDSCTLGGIAGEWDVSSSCSIFNIETNADDTSWVITSSEDWLTIYSYPLPPYNYGTIMVLANENYYGTTPRTAEVYIQVASGVADTVVVTQEPFCLYSNPDSIVYTNGLGEVQELNLITYSDWRIESLPEWLSASVVSGTESAVIKLTVIEEYSSSSDLIDELVFVAWETGRDYSVMDTFRLTVIQESEAYIKIPIDSCTLDGIAGEWDDGNIVSFMIETNTDYTDWEFSSSASWLGIEGYPPAPSEYPQMYIYAAEDNFGLEVRTAEAYITVAPGVVDTVLVTQEPFSITASPSCLSFSSDSADTKILEVSTYQDPYGMYISPDWLTSTYQRDKKSLELKTTEENTSAYARTGTIAFGVFGETALKSYKDEFVVTVSQEGNPYLTVPITKCTLNGLQSNMYGTNVNVFTVETNVDVSDLEFSSSASWVSVDFYPSWDYVDPYLVITPDETNYSSESRTAYVQITAASGVSESVKVTQKPFFIDVNPDSLSFTSANDRSQSVYVDTYGDWYVSYLPDWLSVSKESGDTYERIIFTTTEENTFEYREDEVVFYMSESVGNDADSIELRLNVSQEAVSYDAYLIADWNSDSDQSNGGFLDADYVSIDAGILVKVYPNPATEYVFIQPDGGDLTDADISLYDNTGKRIYSEHIDRLNVGSKYSVDLSTYSSGVYVVYINGSNYTKHETIIKQ